MLRAPVDLFELKYYINLTLNQFEILKILRDSHSLPNNTTKNLEVIDFNWIC